MSTRPRHMAIIMDGNGRWAQARKHSRVYGHVRGAKVAKRIIEACAKQGLENLTLFAFSTENWLRPAEEVSFLMGLLLRRLSKEKLNLMKNNIRFHCIGDISKLPEQVRILVQKTIEETQDNSGMNLVFALSYGGRQELTQAMRELATKAKAGEIEPGEIDEALIGSSLQSSFLPDPDLIIRTSGESRISNFFLWQAAYSELYITERNWPEFTEQDLSKALEAFAGRERRFGQICSQRNLSQEPAPLS